MKVVKVDLSKDEAMVITAIVIGKILSGDGDLSVSDLSSVKDKMVDALKAIKEQERLGGWTDDPS